MIQPGVTEHYLGRVSPFGDPWISARSGSPGHFVACHVLRRLLAPRHPPRALCSLTSLSSSPSGKCGGTIGVISPCHHFGEIEVLRLYCRSRLHLERFVRPRGLSASSADQVQRSAGGWHRACVRWHSSGDRCCSHAHAPAGHGPGAGLVETRRLELLTLSLQRRCSSS